MARDCRPCLPLATRPPARLAPPPHPPPSAHRRPGAGDDDFEWITAELAKLGGGALPIISVLEGGYNVEVLPGSVRAHLRALSYK